jgi:hypothetical protein
MTSSEAISNADSAMTDPPLADDPEILLGLLSDGKLDVFTPDSDGMVEIQPSGFWDSAISEIFLPVQPSDPKPNSSKSRSSSHRLLTSEQILLEKQNLQRKKEEANLKKQMRQEKKAAKKNQM